MPGRGGLKLEAALERFGLGAAVTGARAVDVGASTGGFTAALLRHGAVNVTAVDVGHGQLHTSLRSDARVTVLEKTDWKTLSLSVAPGPFDFFSVDVSFVAARNMLRGLAFRLRDGAEGIVLLKPQFELPPHEVKGGDVSDPALRARALEQFTTKATALGFAIVGHIDSPVAGGSGTVEILLHLRFAGRSARLPAPGESRGQKPRPGRKRQGRSLDVVGTAQAWFAVAAPGLEAPLKDEVARLPGVTQVRTVPGGVSFSGPLEVGMRANLGLRVASRVLLRLGGGKAREFAKLRRLIADLRWDAFLPTDRPIKISASASSSRLYHTGAIGETVALGIGDRVGDLPSAATAGPDDGDEPDTAATRILIRGDQDQWMVSLDSSGELLHRRGWRLEAGKAPLRETLAAGLLALCEYDPALPFVDPMCGAGTIALEACTIALGRAPGLGRSFAFQTWRCHDADLWQRLLDEARAAIKDRPPAPIFASDRDARLVETARRNAERAGLLPHVHFEAAAFGDRPAPGPAGLVLLNPPYGRRLGSRNAGTQVARDIGRVLRARFAGWGAGIVVADRAADKALGLPVKNRAALSNGGIRVQLLRI